MYNFLNGFRFAFKGFTLIRHRGLRWHVLIPLILNIALMALALRIGYHYLDSFSHMLQSYLPAFLDWLAPLLVIIALPLLLILAFYLSTIIANIIAAPFNGFLAEKVETILLGYPPPSQRRLISQGSMVLHMIQCELIKLGYILLITLPLLLLSFVPVINVVMPFIWLLVGSWLLSVEYMDYPLGNHNIRFSQQLGLLKQHKATTLGFGLGIMLITIIPVLNLLAMPVATCSASSLWVNYYSRYVRE